MRLRVLHQTRYLYSQPVNDSHNEVRLMPVSDTDQTCLSFRLSATPAIHVFSYELPVGRVHHFNLRPSHRELNLAAESVVITHRRNPFLEEDFPLDTDGFYKTDDFFERYVEYLSPTKRVPLLPEIDPFVDKALAEAQPGPASFPMAVMGMMHREFTYMPGSTTVDSPLERVIETKQGVCQDFTHLMLAICRRHGIPARYVSGYLYTAGSDAKLATPQRDSLEEAAKYPSLDLTGGDATHAWVECLLPNNGWYGFDPTNNLVTTDAYIKVHNGRDYDDVSPLRGVYRGSSESTLEVAVHVTAEG
jgi:transglutaminase-like putative cysteine protease